MIVQVLRASTRFRIGARNSQFIWNALRRSSYVSFWNPVEKPLSTSPGYAADVSESLSVEVSDVTYDGSFGLQKFHPAIQRTIRSFYNGKHSVGMLADLVRLCDEVLDFAGSNPKVSLNGSRMLSSRNRALLPPDIIGFRQKAGEIITPLLSSTTIKSARLKLLGACFHVLHPTGATLFGDMDAFVADELQKALSAAPPQRVVNFHPCTLLVAALEKQMPKFHSSKSALLFKVLMLKHMTSNLAQNVSLADTVGAEHVEDFSVAMRTIVRMKLSDAITASERNTLLKYAYALLHRSSNADAIDIWVLSDISHALADIGVAKEANHVDVLQNEVRTYNILVFPLRWIFNLWTSFADAQINSQ